ncbi:hypothetical protein K449DRAFT_405611 [Hypoxylon sp. EC38]|nr:hypothetical protein K449DRAFT_405611 [Hypoxylon sp. EC38]
MARFSMKEVGNNGLGLMCLTSPGANITDDQAFAILKAALTADRYFDALSEGTDKVVVCIESGVVDMKTHTMDGSPQGVRKFAANSSSILGKSKKIDIFGISRVDPDTPITENVKALAELVSEGCIGGIQFSEVGDETIHNGVAETCSKLSIPIHRVSPRFQPAKAAEKGCSTAQLQRPSVPPIIPVFGCGSPKRTLRTIELADEDCKSIDSILLSFPVAGTRYTLVEY